MVSSLKAIALTILFTGTVYANDVNVNSDKFVSYEAATESLSWIVSHCKIDVKVYGQEGLLKESCTRMLEFDYDLVDVYTKEELKVLLMSSYSRVNKIVNTNEEIARDMKTINILIAPLNK